jgi:hypothetical protein
MFLDISTIWLFWMNVLITHGPFCYAISLTRSPLSHFFAYVSTQFGCTIQSIQCDNGREFDNSSRTFFLSYDVQFQKSSLHVPIEWQD